MTQDQSNSQSRSDALFEIAAEGLNNPDSKGGTVSIVVAGFSDSFQIDLIEWCDTDPEIIAARRANGQGMVFFGAGDLRAVQITPHQDPFGFL